MEAKTAQISDLVSAPTHYNLPLFQRKYVWEKHHWDKLWEDIDDLCQNPNANDHFIGSVVTVQQSNITRGVSTYMLIDGQQRLTTIFILLLCLRNAFKSQGNSTWEEIQDYLTNKHKDRTAFYKLLPTQKDGDRDIYCQLVDSKGDIDLSKEINLKNNIYLAFKYFTQAIHKTKHSLDTILNTIIDRICVVEIILQTTENPNLVFESLNSTGQTLYASDLIRNYFFMHIASDQQTAIYNQYWSKIEEGLKDDDLTDFIRHYLQKEGVIVKMSNIYIDLKAKVGNTPISIMEDLLVFVNYYKRFVSPDREPNTKIRLFLERLKVLDNTTVYPFLLNCFHAVQQKTILEKDLIEVLSVLETLLLRRFFCGGAWTSNALTKYFPILYQQARNLNGTSFSEAVKKLLAEKYLPTDLEFKEALTKREMYKATHNNSKTTLLLAGIDQSLGKKDKIDYSECTIEHIMPQKLTEWWKEHLGSSNWEETHRTLVHNLGNLTLTSDNSELSNKPFPSKKEQLKEKSRVLLNKYFENKIAWRAADIQKRAEYLADKCIEIWPLFAETPEKPVLGGTVTGTSPTKLTIKGQVIWAEKQSWRQVLISVAEYICANYPNKIPELLIKSPTLLSESSLNTFRAPELLKSGIYLETHGAAEVINRHSEKMLEFVGISKTEWKVDKVLK